MKQGDFWHNEVQNFEFQKNFCFEFVVVKVSDLPI